MTEEGENGQNSLAWNVEKLLQPTITVVVKQLQQEIWHHHNIDAAFIEYFEVWRLDFVFILCPIELLLGES